MDIKEVMECLKEGAVKAGICRQGRDFLAGLGSLERILDYYVQNPDWCMERDFPSYDTLEKLSLDPECRSLLEKAGVYVGKEFQGELLNERQSYVFHRCRGWITASLNIERHLIPIYYFANGCEMTVQGSDVCFNNPVRIPLYLTASCKVKCEKNRSFYFPRYLIERI